VGTVWFGLARAEGTATLHRRFRGARSEVKLQAAWTALDWLRRTLLGVG
jgi:nicotinamide-nucleotide amidase